MSTTNHSDVARRVEIAKRAHAYGPGGAFFPEIDPSHLHWNAPVPAPRVERQTRKRGRR
jgi:hypothetical protein